MSSCTMAEPMNPVAPVTKTRMAVVLLSAFPFASVGPVRVRPSRGVRERREPLLHEGSFGVREGGRFRPELAAQCRGCGRKADAGRRRRRLGAGALWLARVGRRRGCGHGGQG